MSPSPRSLAVACDTASMLAATAAAPEQAAIRTHPWLRALAAGALQNGQLAEWAQQTRLLCHAELRALGALGSYGLPADMDGLLAHLRADARKGMVWLE